MKKISLGSFKKLSVPLAVVGSAFVATAANAADSGDGGALASLTAAQATTAGIAGAALTIYIGIKVFKYIRQAL